MARHERRASCGRKGSEFRVLNRALQNCSVFGRTRKGIFLGTTNVIPTLSAVNALPSAAILGVYWSGAAPCGFQGPGLD